MRKSPGGGREGQMRKTIPAEDIKKGKGRRSKIARKEGKEQKSTVKVKPSPAHI